ncbi:MAG: ATP-binding protein [Deltaproteobacteria bacterium]|nr:ATP-binding protein [Deltaproteobacteria bacterium]
MSGLIEPRYLTSHIQSDLREKMVFLGGPRQVGKTTLAQSLIRDYRDQHPAYLTWDNLAHQKRIREQLWPSTEKLIVLDEIHKFKAWRTLIKGFYDTLKNTHSFLITGSARLDHFRKGGDSLLGRYHYYRLHPFSLAEVGHSRSNLESLFKFGGFPEPFLKQSERALRRWHMERLHRLVRIDLRDLEHVQDLDKVGVLAEELPRRVGSPLSTQSLANDLSVDFKTVKRWISILDSLYYCFQIPPLGAPKIKAVKKEQKLYLWDWSQVEDAGARFENMVACHLLKFCHFHQDVDGRRMELRYLRDINKREVDFVVVRDKSPLFAVECKLSERETPMQLRYFSERTSIPKFYQVHMGDTHKQVSDRISVLPFLKFSEIARLL